MALCTCLLGSLSQAKPRVIPRAAMVPIGGVVAVRDIHSRNYVAFALATMRIIKSMQAPNLVIARFLCD